MACSITGRPCRKHFGAVHGKEAEDLRSGVEALLCQRLGLVELRRELQVLLDSVDARDSLAYLEQR